MSTCLHWSGFKRLKLIKNYSEEYEKKRIAIGVSETMHELAWPYDVAKVKEISVQQYQDIFTFIKDVYPWISFLQGEMLFLQNHEYSVMA